MRIFLSLLFYYFRRWPSRKLRISRLCPCRKQKTRTCSRTLRPRIRIPIQILNANSNSGGNESHPTPHVMYDIGHESRFVQGGRSNRSQSGNNSGFLSGLLALPSANSSSGRANTVPAVTNTRCRQFQIITSGKVPALLSKVPQTLLDLETGIWKTGHWS